jgi:hypothetical protein
MVLFRRKREILRPIKFFWLLPASCQDWLRGGEILHGRAEVRARPSVFRLQSWDAAGGSFLERVVTGSRLNVPPFEEREP